MNRRLRSFRKSRPGKALLTLVAIASLGWFAANPGYDLAVTAYDSAVWKSCRDDLTRIRVDYEIYMGGVPYSGFNTLAKDYMKGEKRITERVAAMRCPITIADEQAAFVAANTKWVEVLEGFTTGEWEDHGLVRRLVYQHAGVWWGFPDSEPYAAMSEFTLALAERIKQLT